jgi:hypothetical protein
VITAGVFVTCIRKALLKSDPWILRMAYILLVSFSRIEEVDTIQDEILLIKKAINN